MSTQYISKQRLKELEQELEDLKARRPDISSRIQEAKELGDISENADYGDAKEAQAFNEGRIVAIERLIQTAEVVSKRGSKDEVGVGSTVDVQSKKFGKQTFSITGASEADPAEGRISNESPIGTALLEKKKGDKALVETPKGKIEYTIKKIS